MARVRCVCGGGPGSRAVGKTSLSVPRAACARQRATTSAAPTTSSERLRPATNANTTRQSVHTRRDCAAARVRARALQRHAARALGNFDGSRGVRAWLVRRGRPGRDRRSVVCDISAALTHARAGRWPVPGGNPQRGMARLPDRTGRSRAPHAQVRHPRGADGGSVIPVARRVANCSFRHRVGARPPNHFPIPLLSLAFGGRTVYAISDSADRRSSRVRHVGAAVNFIVPGTAAA